MIPSTIRIEIVLCKYSIIQITPWSTIFDIGCTVFIKIMIMNFGVYHNRDFDAGLVYEPTYGCDTFEDTRFYGCSGIFHTNDLGSKFYYRCGSLSTIIIIVPIDFQQVVSTSVSWMAQRNGIMMQVDYTVCMEIIQLIEDVLHTFELLLYIYYLSNKPIIFRR